MFYGVRLLASRPSSFLMRAWDQPCRVRALTGTTKRSANIERKMLAVVIACEKFHSHIFGKKFIVDHKPLKVIHMKNLTAAPSRLQRMLLRIQGCDMTVKYKPGTEMVLADPMSKLNPLPSEESLNLQGVCLAQFSCVTLDKDVASEETPNFCL